MQRDPDLIRSILLKIEANESPGAPESLQNESRRDDRLGYHCWLLYDSGLIDAVEISRTNGRSYPVAMPLNLTSAGHDFIDAIGDDSTWKVMKERVAETGKAMGSLTLEVMKSLAVEVTKQQLGIGVV